jgi:two-component system, sensor histidine kinase
LHSWGCRVMAASSLTLASALLADAPDVSVIVSDFRLGEADDGMGAIFKLRAQAGRHVPACLVSGDLDGALMQMARDAGITLLHKPVRPAKMRSLLRHLFNNSSTVPEPRLH